MREKLPFTRNERRFVIVAVVMALIALAIPVPYYFLVYQPTRQASGAKSMERQRLSDAQFDAARRASKAYSESIGPRLVVGADQAEAMAKSERVVEADMEARQLFMDYITDSDSADIRGASGGANFFLAMIPLLLLVFALTCAGVIWQHALKWRGAVVGLVVGAFGGACAFVWVVLLNREGTSVIACLVLVLEGLVLGILCGKVATDMRPRRFCQYVTGFVLLVLLAGIACPAIRGHLQGETFYHGLPLSYWRSHLQDKGQSRTNAYSAVTYLRDKESVPVLIAALKKPDTRKDALLALEKFGSPDANEAIGPLVELLQTPKPTDDYSISLEWFGPEAIPIVAKAMDHKDPVVRARATKALGKLGWRHKSPAVLPHLGKALQDESEWVRREGLLAVSWLGTIALPLEDSVIKIVATFPNQRLDALVALKLIDPEGWKLLIPLLKPPVTPELQHFREDHELSASVCAAMGLYGARAKEAVPILVGKLKSEFEDVRIYAALALKKIDPEAAAKAGVK